MADLTCVPGSVTLNCGVQTRITVKTSDKKAGVIIRTLGFDDSVASINPGEGTTNDSGFADFFITCRAIGQGCPAETTFTFDAVDYDDCDVDVECVDRFPPPAPAPEPDEQLVPLAFALAPVSILPQILFDGLKVGYKLAIVEDDLLEEPGG